MRHVSTSVMTAISFFILANERVAAETVSPENAFAYVRTLPTLHEELRRADMAISPFLPMRAQPGPVLLTVPGFSGSVPKYFIGLHPSPDNHYLAVEVKEGLSGFVDLLGYVFDMTTNRQILFFTDGVVESANRASCRSRSFENFLNDLSHEPGTTPDLLASYDYRVISPAIAQGGIIGWTGPHSLLVAYGAGLTAASSRGGATRELGGDRFEMELDVTRGSASLPVSCNAGRTTVALSGSISVKPPPAPPPSHPPYPVMYRKTMPVHVQACDPTYFRRRTCRLVPLLADSAAGNPP